MRDHQSNAGQPSDASRKNERQILDTIRIGNLEPATGRTVLVAHVPSVWLLLLFRLSSREFRPGRVIAAKNPLVTSSQLRRLCRNAAGSSPRSMTSTSADPTMTPSTNGANLR